MGRPGAASVMTSFWPQSGDRVGAARLRCYAVLFDLWAYGKWLDNTPTATDKHSWGPTRNLVAAAEGKSWTDRAINELA